MTTIKEESIGTVGGAPVEFEYHRNETKRELLIHYVGHDTSRTIQENDVIAVVQSGQASNENIVAFLVPMSESDVKGSNLDFRYEEIVTQDLPPGFVKANCMSSYSSSLSPLRAQNAASFYVVISTRSGTMQAEQYYNHIVKKALKSLLFSKQEYQEVFTESDESIARFGQKMLEKANRGFPQTVLLLSGDGGPVDVLNALALGPRSASYVRPRIGIIAMGTGNALANSIGVNKDNTRGLRHFLRGSPNALPSFCVLFSPESSKLVNEGTFREPLPRGPSSTLVLYGAVVCSWGLHASLVADSDTTEYRRYGSERFAMVAKELLAPTDGSPPHEYQGKITLAKKSENGSMHQEILSSEKHEYALATMVSNLEEKLTISPFSKPLDGQLRLVYFAPLPSEKVMEIMGLAYQGGSHIKRHEIRYESIENLTINFEEVEDRWRRVCIDGTIVQIEKGGWMKVARTEVDVVDIVVDLEP